MDIKELRKLFPVTDKYIFLNNAAESPLNLKFKKKLDDYLHMALYQPQNKPSIREEIKIMLSELLGGDSNEYALMTSTGLGVSIVAAGYNWSKDDNVVVPRGEHWNNIFPWKALEKKGLDVRFVPVDSENRIDMDGLYHLVDDNTKIVSVAAVSFNTGFRADLKKIAHIAHSHGSLFMVDAIQGAGVVPINVLEDSIDILCCAGFKWLLGMPGTGFLYINKNIQHLIRPVLPGMFAADILSNALDYYPDARKFETGSIAYSLFYGWTAGLELVQKIGINNIYDRVMSLTDRIISGLKEKNIEIISPIENPADRSGILIFTMGSTEANKDLYKNLLDKNIILTLREGMIRVSPSFYNTEEEIDQFLNAI